MKAFGAGLAGSSGVVLLLWALGAIATFPFLNAALVVVGLLCVAQGSR